MDPIHEQGPPQLPVVVAVVETEQSVTNSPRKRPGRGLATLFITLLTIAGITIFAIKETRRASLIYFLPIFALALLCYIIFICLVKNSDEDEDEPVALKEYLAREKKKKRRRRKKKKREEARLLKEKFVDDDIQAKEEEDSSVSILGNKAKSDDAVQGISIHENTLTIAETFSLGADSMLTRSNTDPMDAENIFVHFFPALSKSFEEVESQFHTIAMQIQNKIRPPAECQKCKNGTHGMDDDSTLCPYYEQCRVVTDSQNYATETEEEDEHGIEVPMGTDSMEEIPISSPISKVNLSGKFKLVHNHNFMEFLKALNIPVLLRKAANATRPIHTYHHNGDRLDVHVDGIVKGSSAFIIDGPPCESSIRHMKFEDYCTWSSDGQSIIVRKVALNAPPNGPDYLLVKRELGNNGHNLIISSKAIYGDGSESLESVQTYHRIG